MPERLKTGGGSSLASPNNSAKSQLPPDASQLFDNLDADRYVPLS
ncbi:hypothetical protein DB31_2920 [Hyalangium minutum]|uniref:Uncharacterized protein n=1 Tax=Hyalangium minutum TaxID=394096 RepID=A0A085W6L4_9BACT|nr:hypothetical protein DB31_2920 [Hyalangium minutum]